MKVIVVDEKSPYLAEVQKLGDVNRSTLGFLPEQAFQDYARKKHIVALLETSAVAAYIMYRYKGTALIIVHLCVGSNFRKKGYAKFLVEYLLQAEKDIISHMQLACRRDYNLSDFWRSLGFFPVSEKDGRATRQNTRLTIWSRPNPFCQNFFTIAVENQRKAVVVLDTNIVIDLSNETSGETEYLHRDYVNNYVQYYVSSDVLIEIERSNRDSVRKASRDYVLSNFEVLQTDEVLYTSVLNNLLSEKPAEKYSNTWFDISHISYAISAGASSFITRDSSWLNNAFSQWIQERYGLNICSPGEFIKQIDELDSPESYAPQKLMGLNISWGEMRTEDFSAVVGCFYPQFGKKAIFETQLREKMANPQKYHIHLVKLKDEIASIACVEFEEQREVVSFFLVNEDVLKLSLYNTFVKWFAFHILDEAKASKKSKVVFRLDYMNENIREILLECGYMQDEKVLFRLIVSCIAERDNFERMLLEGNCITNNSKIVIDKHIFWSPASEIRLEKLFWPLKLTPSTIPCYVVPIAAEYARDLFDENLSAENPSLFENEKISPALSTENVYFKKTSHSIKEFPAHILWYVSYSKKLMGTGMIRACSILDSVEIRDSKLLFQKYQRLGVIDWDRLQSFGKPGELITVYNFSYTELFKSPIPLNILRKELGRSNETFQSYRKITYKEFLDLYQMGMGDK